jgi:hypothetical protein
MTKQAAKALAAKLGYPNEKDADLLLDFCKLNKLVVGVDNKTGEWVVITEDRKVTARTL